MSSPAEKHFSPLRESSLKEECVLNVLASAGEFALQGQVEDKQRLIVVDLNVHRHFKSIEALQIWHTNPHHLHFWEELSN